MSHSVRRTLVDWLKGHVYQLAKRTVEKLGGPYVHTNTGGYVNHRSGLAVGVNGSQGYVNNTVLDPVLGEEVNKHGARLGVSYLPLDTINQHALSGLRGNFVNHQQGSSLNLQTMKNYAANQAACANLAYPKAKESSGGDK